MNDAQMLAAIARCDQALGLLDQFIPALMEQAGDTYAPVGYVEAGNGSAVDLLGNVVHALPRDELNELAVQAIMQVALAHLRINEIEAR